MKSYLTNCFMKTIFRALYLTSFAASYLVGAETKVIDRAQLAYNLATTVDAYEQAGHRDVKWDREARHCLRIFATLRSLSKGDSEELFSDLKTNLTRLQALKCDDPLIGYLCVRYVSPGLHSGFERAKAYQDVAIQLESGKYPDIRKFYALLWTYNTLAATTPAPQMSPIMLETAGAYLAKALADPALPYREAEQACDQLLSAPWWADERGTRWTCYQLLEPTLEKRWAGTSATLLAKGRAYLAYAWQARGNGYAHTVSKSSWGTFAQRLGLATEALEAAWKLNPQDPRICQEMMRVELGQGQGLERLNLWFQRGMSIDPANQGLCAEKLEYLRPRWYGSLQDMIAFGRECTLNTNWQGNVRLLLADAHFQAAREILDNQQRAAYWLRPEVWPDIQLTFEQFFKLNPAAVGYRHNYALYAARCEQWGEFLNQAKLFPSTNHTYFGGEEKFNQLIKTAQKASGN